MPRLAKAERAEVGGLLRDDGVLRAERGLRWRAAAFFVHEDGLLPRQ